MRRARGLLASPLFAKAPKIRFAPTHPALSRSGLRGNSLQDLMRRLLGRAHSQCALTGLRHAHAP